jgi:tape measure domain-containing protein
VASGNIQFGIQISANATQAIQQIGQLGRGVNDSARAASAAASSFSAASAAVARYAGAAATMFSAGRLIKLADEWGQLSSRIQIAAGSADLAAEASSRLMEVSNRTYKSFGNSAELFIRTSEALGEIGYSADAALGMVEALQYGLTVSSANAERSANVIQAWSKSILQGKMGMEEFQSVMGGAPRVIQALADSLGVSLSGLQAMVHEGKVTADALAGVANQAEILGAETEKMPVTLADAFQRAENSLMKFAGSAEQNHGVIRALTSGITALSDNIDIVAAAAGTVGVAALARYASGLASAAAATRAKTVATQQAAIAEAELALAQARTAIATAAATANSTALAAARTREAAATAALTVASRGASAATGLARGAVAALGGPVGALVTALGAAALAWETYSGRVAEAAKKSEDAEKRLEHVRRRLAGESDEDIRISNELISKKDELAEAEKRLASARLAAATGAYAFVREAAAAEIPALEKAAELARAQIELLENNGMSATRAADARWSKYMSGRRSDAEKLRAELDEENTAFKMAVKKYQKTDAEYIAALEAHNRKVAEIEKKYAKKEPKAKREPKQTDTEKAYEGVMKNLTQAESRAKAETEGLTGAQLTLRDVMASPEWQKMPQAWRDLVTAQAQATTQAEATAVYQRTMNDITAATNDARKETLDLSSAMGSLYDLMLLPEWARMSETERQSVAAHAESEDAIQREIDAMATYKQAMDSISASVAEARKSTMELDAAMSELYDLMASPAWGQMSEAARVNAVEQATAASAVIRETEESKNKMGFSSLQQDLSRSVASGLVDGFSNGDSLAKSLGSSLQNALLNYSQKGLEEGISKALDIASDWIADLFSSMSSSMSSSAGGSGSGWGSIFSAIGAWFASAQGNAFTSAGPVRAFARGGAFGAGEILTKPTFFRFASGGAWRNGVAGEAGPEAALPLKRLSDGTLGVATDGGSGGPVTINIVMNADGGQSETDSGDAGDYRVLAKRLGAVVRQVVVEEKRPGGLLAGT